MGSDILSLIDNAIDDYLSDDAMRWRPEPPEPAAIPVHVLDVTRLFGVPPEFLRTPPPVIDVAFFEAMGVELTRWQQSLMAAFEAAAKAMQPTLARMSESLAALEPVLRQVEADRRARLRRMHHLYRMRRR